MYIVHGFIQELQTFREVLENIWRIFITIFIHIYTQCFYWMLVLSAKEHSFNIVLNIINTTK